MNVKYDAKSNLVTVTFNYDPKGTFSPSKTGKSKTVATTGGNIVVPGTDGLLKVGVNAYVPNNAA